MSIPTVRLVNVTDTLVTGPSSTVGFFGVTPVAAGTAYTQTYATASKTVPAATAVGVATTGATNSSPYGYSQAQADALVTQANANAADILAVKKVVTAIIDDLQAIGLVL